MQPRRLPSLRRLAIASVVGAALSGAPSTLVTIVRREPLLDSTRAAGALVLDRSRSPAALVVAGGVAHVAISAWWTLVLGAVLPRGRRARWGALAGLAIAALDLGIVGRRVPSIRELSLGPQVADHVAFGVLVGAVLDLTEPVHGPGGAAGTLRAS